MQGTLVVFSGGPDSTAAALYFLDQGDDVALITFETRWRDQSELYAAMKVAEKLKLPLAVVDFRGPLMGLGSNVHPFMHAGTTTSLRDRTAPHMQPFGATTLLAYAASYAVYQGYSQLGWGATADDRRSLPEYSQDYVDKLAELVLIATDVPLKITAPFSSRHKPQVLAAYRGKEELFALTWSCKIPTRGMQCGMCAACRARNASARLAGIPDLSSYAQVPEIKLPEAIVKPIEQFTEEDWKTLNDAVPLESESIG